MSSNNHFPGSHNNEAEELISEYFPRELPCRHSLPYLELGERKDANDSVLFLASRSLFEYKCLQNWASLKTITSAPARQMAEILIWRHFCSALTSAAPAVLMPLEPKGQGTATEATQRLDVVMYPSWNNSQVAKGKTAAKAQRKPSVQNGNHVC